MNRPASASGFEEDYQTVVVENGHDISESSNRPKKLRLTKEQSRLLEESFKQNQTLNLVSLFSSSLLLVPTMVAGN